MNEDFAKFSEELLRKVADSMGLTYEEYTYEWRVFDPSDSSLDLAQWNRSDRRTK